MSERIRFILVQLPERIPEHPRFGNIADVTKERLRCVGAKIREENPLFMGDLGFRVFKLDSSNIHAWEANRDQLDKSLLESVDHIVPGRTEALHFHHSRSTALPPNRSTP